MQDPAWRWDRSRLLDATLAMVVAGIALAGSIGEETPKQHVSASQLRFLQSHQPHFAYSLVVIAGLALFWRRRWPLPVLAIAVGLTAAYSASGYVPGAMLIAVDVALYSVARIENRTTAIAAGAVTALTLFVTSGLGGPFGWLGGTNTVMVVCVIAAVAIGMAVAARQQVFVTMQERAERAERDREEEARRRVDAERLRIARELHDVVAHTMSMINIQAGVAAHVLDEKPEQAAQALGAIRDASREGLRELRAVLNVLRKVEESEETSPAPGLDQLTALIDATSQAGIQTSLEIEGRRPASLPKGLELAAYRIVQESLTNVLRHAGPGARATVTVSFKPGILVLNVVDDGKPALVTAGSIPSSPIGTGAGIGGMRERAATFGGTVTAGPRDEGGWRVTAVLEVPEGQQDRETKA